MGARAMPFPWANLALLLFVVAQLVTGVAGLLGTSDPFPDRLLASRDRRVRHRRAPVREGDARSERHSPAAGPPVRRVTLTLLVLLLLAVLVTGIVWISVGRTIYVLGISVINLHAYLALALVGLLAWHVVVDRRWIVRVPAAPGRGALSQNRRSRRRWTRSLAGRADCPAPPRRAGEPAPLYRLLQGGKLPPSFPAVSWLNDDPEPVSLDLSTSSWWTATSRTLELTYDQLDALRAALTTTIGCRRWYSEQEWRGVALAALLAEAGVDPEAESVSVESITEFGRGFSLADAQRLTLATCGRKALSHGHGFPARLVVPDQRGFDWVKWVTRITVSSQPSTPVATSARLRALMLLEQGTHGPVSDLRG